jgi:hypothetical protein
MKSRDIQLMEPGQSHTSIFVQFDNDMNYFRLLFNNLLSCIQHPQGFLISQLEDFIGFRQIEVAIVP